MDNDPRITKLGALSVKLAWMNSPQGLECFERGYESSWEQDRQQLMNMRHTHLNKNVD